jgi:hypothetical protein
MQNEEGQAGLHAGAHSLSRHCQQVGARTFLSAATSDGQNGLGIGRAALRFGACCGQECPRAGGAAKTRAATPRC